MRGTPPHFEHGVLRGQAAGHFGSGADRRRHCHGPDGAGSSFAPGLIAPLADRERFATVTLEGVAGLRGVMRGFAGDPNVAPYLDAIYAYLAERAAGRLGRGRP